MPSTAITEVITTLAEAERQFNLTRTEEEQFFSEWRMRLPNFTDAERTGLNELRRRYLYQRAESQMSEGTFPGCLLRLSRIKNFMVFCKF